MYIIKLEEVHKSKQYFCLFTITFLVNKSNNYFIYFIGYVIKFQ